MAIRLKKKWGTYVCPTVKDPYDFQPVLMENSPDKAKRRLLVVYDAPVLNDKDMGEIHSYSVGASLRFNQPDWKKFTPPAATIDKAISLAGYDKWEKVAVAWQFHDLDDLPSTLVDIAFDAFDKRLAFYVDKFKPDRILFLGDAPLVTLSRKLGSKIPVGRVFDYKGIKALWTVPAQPICVSGAGTSSLLGQVIDHAYYLRKPNEAYTARKVESETIFCDTLDKVERALADCMNSPEVAFDTEGDNLNRINNTLLTVQLAPSAEKGYFIPFAHVDSPFVGKSLEKLRVMLREFFHNYSGRIITAHGKYDFIMCRVQLGVPHMRFKNYDVAAGEFALDENAKYYSAVTSAQKLYAVDNKYNNAKEDSDRSRKNQLSGWSLQRIEENYGIERPEDVLGKDQRTNMSAVPLDKIVPYGMLDVFDLHLIKEQQVLAGERRGFANFTRYVEHLGLMPLVFASQEARGIPCDVEHLLSLRKPDGPVRKAIREAKEAIMNSKEAKLANQKMLRKRHAPTKSLWSNQDSAFVFSPDTAEGKQTLFVDVMHLGGYTLTEKGTASIGKAFFKNNSTNPLVEKFQEYVEAKTFKTSFVDSFAEIMTIDEDARSTGRIRSSYGFLNVLTGRTSSFNP